LLKRKKRKRKIEINGSPRKTKKNSTKTEKTHLKHWWGCQP
jgi:hypothetical protein